MLTSDASPVVSVIICTRDRPISLAAAVRSVLDQGADSPPYEVIVVDNGSTGDVSYKMGQVVSHSGLRFLREPRVGVCHARNTGWRAATGEFVAYLDDDAIAGAGWLKAVVDAFAIAPQTGAVGGRVEPVWEVPPPAWLSERVALSLTIVNWSDRSKILENLRSEWLVGANMAVRRTVLSAVGGFRPELDRSGSSMLSSGDIYLLRQIQGLGLRCVYYPDMSVRHVIPSSRVTKRWFRKRYFWQGVSNAVMDVIDAQPSNTTRAKLAALSALRLLRRPRWLITLLPGDDPDRHSRRCWTVMHVGYVAGLCGVGRRA